MLKRKSTLATPVFRNKQTLVHLARLQNFHNIEAKYYSLEFQGQADPDAVCLEITPYQHFCQLMAEHHQAAALVISKEIDRVDRKIA